MLKKYSNSLGSFILEFLKKIKFKNINFSFVALVVNIYDSIDKKIPIKSC